VGPRVGLDTIVKRKIAAPAGSGTSVVHPVAVTILPELPRLRRDMYQFIIVINVLPSLAKAVTILVWLNEKQIYFSSLIGVYRINV
jgi:hypothetical protein